MPVHKLLKAFLVPILLLFVSFPLLARASQGAGDQAQRQTAISLFNAGKRLEALPLLEELAQRDPKDSEVLVALTRESHFCLEEGCGG